MLLREFIDGEAATREIQADFDLVFDVVVAGLGTAGAIALLTAAENGLHCLGIERLCAMGGTGTLGTISGYYFGSSGGRYEKINARVSKLEQTIYVPRSHADAKIQALEEEAYALGAKIDYGCTVTGVYTQEKAICGIRVLYEDGRSKNIGAKVVIDATGEAEICYIAGCECLQGRSWDHQTQPFTFSSALIDETTGRRMGINRDAGYVDQNNYEALGAAMVHANTLAIHLKEDYREGNRYVALSPLAGVREGRTIQGRKQLRFSDIVLGTQEEQEPVFYAFSNVDNHGKDIAFEGRLLADWYLGAGLWGLLFSVPVPLESMLPREYDNLLVAGRCLCVDHDLSSCVRMKSDMEKCGEAAAQAASIAIEKGCAIDQIPYQELAERLKKTGCLDQKNHRGFIIRTPQGALDENRVYFMTDETEILQGLASEKPGLAIWSVRRSNGKMLPALRKALQNGNEALKRHAAMALALCQDSSGANILREMVKERDPVILKTSLKYVYTRCTSAIYLLGRLADTQSIPLLFEVLENRGGPLPYQTFEPCELYACQEEVASQYVLFTIRALTEIAKSQSERRNEIFNKLYEETERNDFSVRITLKANPQCFYELAPKVHSYIDYMAHECGYERNLLGKV